MQLLENVLYFVIGAGIIFLMMRYGCGAHIMGHGHPMARQAPMITAAIATCVGWPQIAPLIPFVA